MPSSIKKQSLTMFTAQTVQSAAPTSIANPVQGVDLGQMRYPNEVVCMIHNTAAGGGGNSITCKAWGYHPATEFWYPLGTDSTSANKGLLNEGAAMTITGGTAVNDVRHAEIISGLRGFSHLYIQITAITAVTATCVIAARDLGNR
jgi:hypothetical protein